MASRRTFLTVGTGAALALALGGGMYRATRAAPPAHPFELDGAARAALAAIVPALLAGALLETTAVAPVIDRVHLAILGLPLASQKQVADLFGLLAFGPARRVLTGIAGPWTAAAPADVQGFLQDWRVSQFGLLRSAYGALHDLVLTAWYTEPASWAAIGYPVPKLAHTP